MKYLHVILSLDEKDGGPPASVLAIARIRSKVDEVTILPCTTKRGKMIIEPGKYGRLTILQPLLTSRVILPNRKLDKLIIQEVQKTDIVCIHSNWRYHLISAARACLKYKVPYIISPHGNFGRIPRKHKSYWKVPYFYLFEKKYFKKADAVRYYSQKEFIESNEFLRKDNCIILPHPVEAELLLHQCDDNEIYKRCNGVNPESKVLLYLGRIYWIKQIPVLVRAFLLLYEQTKDFNNHLIIAGPVEEKTVMDEINSLIKSADPKIQKNIHFPGFIRDKIKASFLSRADIFVQPSMHENFGVSIAEAACFGKPCIVNKEVALSDEIKEYKAGICYEGGHIELCSAIYQLFCNPQLMENCSKNAIKLAHKFDGVYIRDNLKEIFKDLIKKKNGKIID